MQIEDEIWNSLRANEDQNVQDLIQTYDELNLEHSAMVEKTQERMAEMNSTISSLKDMNTKLQNKNYDMLMNQPLNVKPTEKPEKMGIDYLFDKEEN